MGLVFLFLPISYPNWSSSQLPSVLFSFHVLEHYFLYLHLNIALKVMSSECKVMSSERQTWVTTFCGWCCCKYLPMHSDMAMDFECVNKTISLSLSLSLSLSHSLTHSLTHSFTHSLTLSLSLSLHLFLYIFSFLSPLHSLTHSLTHSLSLSLSPFISLLIFFSFSSIYICKMSLKELRMSPSIWVSELTQPWWNLSCENHCATAFMGQRIFQPQVFAFLRKVST